MQRVACVAIIIQDSDGKVLLNLRDDRPGLPFANCWTLPGGRIEEDETPEQAASRELHEETGLEMPLTFWKAYERCHPDGDVLIEQHVYIGKTENQVRLVLGEGQALRFFEEEGLYMLPIAYGFEGLLREYYATR